MLNIVQPIENIFKKFYVIHNLVEADSWFGIADNMFKCDHLEAIFPRDLQLIAP